MHKQQNCNHSTFLNFASVPLSSMTLLNNNNNSYNNKEKMIIIIHFNIFHFICMSHNKQKLSTCDKNVERETKLVAQKYRMSVCKTRACHRTEHKNIVSLIAQKSYLSSKKIEIAFVRQTIVARETKSCRSKTHNVYATRGYRRTTDKNIVFVRQDLSPVRQFFRL